MNLSSYITVIASLLTALSVWGAEPTVEMRQMASNYYAYPYPELPLPKLTEAPQGYAPFHIEHYGRHGSRWHIGKDIYKRPVELLTGAERDGKLTPRGQALLDDLRRIEIASRGRDGELTPLGAEQHRGIAQRMYRNFPQVFAGDARVDARSTVVIRCILSMDNELQELYAANPKLRITSDASYADMDYMNHHDTIMSKITWPVRNRLSAYADSVYGNRGDYLKKIINDEKYAKDSINSGSLFWHLYIINANAQSHKEKGFYDIFSDKEIRDQWIIHNGNWYLSYGNSPLTQGAGQHIQRNLLRNIIESADTAISYGKPGANLRFGHETCVMPLTVLMELDHYGKEIDNVEDIAREWKDYEIFPMASNVQMVFYAPVGAAPTPDNVLIKVLLNEQERHLPLLTDTFPYYKWNDVKAYYTAKLAQKEPEVP